MDPRTEHMQFLTRRHFFRRSSLGLGVPALASLVDAHAQAAIDKPTAIGGQADLPHFTPKAKRAIWLFMAGAPAQMDMLDYKPLMQEMFDKDLPDSVRGEQRLTTMTSGQDRFPIPADHPPSRLHPQRRRVGRGRGGRTAHRVCRHQTHPR